MTLSGPPGSGTSTAAERLAEALDVELRSTGQIFREMADEHGMSLDEFGDYVDDHPEIDRELDDRQRRRAEAGDVVLEGRLSGVVAREIPEALTVYLEAPARVRAERVAARDDLDEEEAFEAMWRREAKEKSRYHRIYGVDPDDPRHYDLVLDSSKLEPDEIVEAILDEMPGR